MKTLEEIYNSIKNKFFDKTEIDIEQGTAIDYFMLSSSDMISQAYKEIEDNRTPHIYTSLYGERLDNIGILCGIARRENESDRNYLYRILNWNISNKASNNTAIETALMDMEFASHVTYVPHAFGCGTAAAYIIPVSMDEETMEAAIRETKERLFEVASPSSHIEYIIPNIRSVRITFAYKMESYAAGDTIKDIVEEQVMEYVNGIAPGDYMELGAINRIGNSEMNMSYFSIIQVSINGEEQGDVSILQEVSSKLLLAKEDITWLEVN